MANKKIHPYKLTLWVAMGSILMMFAGFTSAYLVKRSQPNWQGFELPMIFTYSTLVIVLSSISMHFAWQNAKNHKWVLQKQWLIVTAVLGVLFVAMQWLGFTQLQNTGIKLIGIGSNVSGSFLAVIAGMHLLHVVGGLVAIAIILYHSFRSTPTSASALPTEIMSQYWHFVGILWLYLFFFLKIIA